MKSPKMVDPSTLTKKRKLPCSDKSTSNNDESSSGGFNLPLSPSSTLRNTFSLSITCLEKKETAMHKVQSPLPSSIGKSAHSQLLFPDLQRESTCVEVEQTGSGCLKCHKDDDHPNLLICEKCDAEYHTYCLDPPLKCVPEEDFFCNKCIVVDQPHRIKDGLDEKVSTLPPSFTSRFGEIIWASGGAGYGWWPACIYDPRLTVGSARRLSIKNLGKKHLIYFFECHEAPFHVLGETKIVKWEHGIINGYDLGRIAKAIGGIRLTLFEKAYGLASLENDKPVAYRLDWNHNCNGGDIDHNRKVVMSTPQQTSDYPTDCPHKRKRSGKEINANKRYLGQPNGSLSGHTSISEALSKRKGEGMQKCVAAVKDFKPAKTVRKNINTAIKSLGCFPNEIAADKIKDEEFFCKILFKSKLVVDQVKVTASPSIIAMTDLESELNSLYNLPNVGFIILPSKKSSTFADARQKILLDFDDDCLPSSAKWKFYTPHLGPINLKQETNLGAMLYFLQRTTQKYDCGNGTCLNLLRVIICEVTPRNMTVSF